jgi:phenylalanyl-tRNA synthetase beta chain
VEKPWWRNDINYTADLVEEVARVVGYDNIPLSMLSSPLPSGAGFQLVGFRDEVRQVLVACGFQEIITYPLTSIEMLLKLTSGSRLAEPEPLKIANPMSRELEYLRTSIRMGVLSVASRNQRNRDDNTRLFELGKVYLPRKRDLPQEKEVICGFVDSVILESGWQNRPGKADFYTAKGLVEALLSRFGIIATFTLCTDPGLNPVKSADIVVGKDRIGVLGEVHTKVLANFDLAEPAYLFELELAKLMTHAHAGVVYKTGSKYPSIVRDIAVLVDADVDYGAIVDAVKRFRLVTDVVLFDLYTGAQVPEGKKSMAFRITYQSDERTLNDKEVDTLQQDILAGLSKDFKAELRA